MKKLFFSSIIFLLVTLGWGNSSSGQEVPAPRGEIRVVDKHLLNIAAIVFQVFEHLLELDKDGKLVPHLATGWWWLDDRTLEVELRQGVRFHNGEIFDAEIVKLNVEESAQLRHPFYPGEYLNFNPGLRMEIVDAQTIRFLFPEPDGAALAKLSFLHIANRQFYQELGWSDKHW
jgi:ABC-type transport system substrate-binding protein